MTSHIDDFAKIGRAYDGSQVLIFKDNNEENKPIIVIHCVCDGVHSQMTMGFADSDSGRTTRDKTFNEFTQKQFDVVRTIALEHASSGAVTEPLHWNVFKNNSTSGDFK